MDMNTILVALLALTVAALIRDRVAPRFDRLKIWLKAKMPARRWEHMERQQQTAIEITGEVWNYLQMVAKGLAVRNSRAEANEEVIKVDVSDVKLRVIDMAKRAEEGASQRLLAQGQVLEALGVIASRIQELSGRVPQNAAGGVEELLAIKAGVQDVVSKLSGPEAEQVNALYMTSLTNLAKAMDVMLDRQEKTLQALNHVLGILTNQPTGE
jgi:hypothetical protein